MSLPLAAAAQDLRQEVARVLDARGLGADALGIIGNVLAHEVAPPPRTPPLVARILDDPLAATDARAIFDESVPSELIGLITPETLDTKISFEEALARYLAALAEAQAELMAAVGPFDEAGLIASLAQGMPLGRLPEIHRAVDDTRLAHARTLFLSATKRFVEALRAPGMQFPPPQRFDSPIGLVAIGSAGADRHGADAALIIDPGGDDRYERAPASGGAISVIVDLGGNDRYSGSDVAVRALSAIIDVSGNDVYEMKGAGLAAAVAGVSVLVDLDGDDEYEAGLFGEGAALFGLGALIDGRGDDRYRVKAFGQGYGGTGGVGLLWDIAGNDRYSASGLHDTYERGGGISFTQGAAAGARGALAGGIGILRDDAGDDRYRNEMFAQGAGYYYALGLLWDASGDDDYGAVRYGQGNGAHEAVGVLRDEQGNDRYALATGVGQGMGLDLAVGVLLDLAGDDDYRAGAIAQGTGTANGFGLLADESGTNTFGIGGDARAWGHAQWLRGLPTVGVLLHDASKSRFLRDGKAASPLPPAVETEPPQPGLNCVQLSAAQQQALQAMLQDPGGAFEPEILSCALFLAGGEERARLWMAVDAMLVTPGGPFLPAIAEAMRERPAPGPGIAPHLIDHLGDALRPLASCEPHALWVENWAGADEARAALASGCWRLQAAALARLRALGVPAPAVPSTPDFLRAK